MNRDEVFKIINRDLKDSGLTKWDWNDFVKAIDAPEYLDGLFSVAHNMSIITKMMKFPIVRKEDTEWISKLHECSTVVESNLILLTTKFGNIPIKRPSKGATTHPLYYCLFHTCNPGTEPQFHCLLMWSYIAFFKELKDKDAPSLSSSTLYTAFLGLRSLFDRFVTGNPVAGMQLNSTTMQDASKSLKQILHDKNVLNISLKARANIRSIITLLDPHPKNRNQTDEHSTHQRSYFLPTPRRGYLPLTARLVNKRPCFLKNKKWSPRDISIADVQEQEQHVKEEFSDGFSGEIQTKHSLIQTRKDVDSPPELFIYKMKSFSNAIARNNQNIPYKSSISLKEDVINFFNLIQSDTLDLEKRVVFSLHIITGIPMEILTRIPFLSSTKEIKAGIIFIPQSECLFLPVQKPVRKTAINHDSPTHFPLKVPNKMTDLLSRLYMERKIGLDMADLETKDSDSERKIRKKQTRLFLHHATYYQRSMDALTREVQAAQKLKISSSGIENTIVRIGLELGIDPIILGQISQKNVAQSETQSHYTRISCAQIQTSYNRMLSEFFNLNQGGKIQWQ